MTLTHFFTALGFLTRLPFGAPGAPGPAAWSFPLVGLVVGALQALAAQLALWAGLPAAWAAWAALAAGIVLTGALHEDGLADTADGLWGGGDPARRLAIMRDSRIGSYGVLALVLALGLQAAALSAIISAGALWGPLMVAGAASRAAMVPLMARAPMARRDGVARQAGRPSGEAAAIALATALALAVMLSGASAVAIALSGAAVAWIILSVASAKIGGITGDILGATQLCVQIAALACLAA